LERGKIQWVEQKWRLVCMEDNIEEGEGKVGPQGHHIEE
jgi:hypothetical protein